MAASSKSASRTASAAPSRFIPSASPTHSEAAPSVTGEALPAVIVPAGGS
jgi:hypothetical protein